MVHSCFVRSCKNRGKISGISYHEFPKNNFKVWFQILNRTPDKKYSLKNVICSDHFKKDDFDMKDTLRKLKPGAVPTLFLKTAKSKRKLCFKDTDLTELNASQQASSSFQSIQEPSTAILSQTLSHTSTDSITDGSMMVILTTVDEFVTESNSYPPSTSEVVTQRGQRAVPSSSDSDIIGLKGSPTKIRKLVRMFHPYSKSPRKQEKIYNQQKVDIECLRKKLKVQKQKAKRLRKRIHHINDVVRDLKKSNMISENALNHLE